MACPPGGSVPWKSRGRRCSQTPPQARSSSSARATTASSSRSSHPVHSIASSVTVPTRTHHLSRQFIPHADEQMNRWKCLPSLKRGHSPCRPYTVHSHLRRAPAAAPTPQQPSPSHHAHVSPRRQAVLSLLPVRGRTRRRGGGGGGGGASPPPHSKAPRSQPNQRQARSTPPAGAPRIPKPFCASPTRKKSFLSLKMPLPR